MLSGLPWKWTKIILLFLRLHPSNAFQTLLLTESYSISSKGFLPPVVDRMVIWIKLTHSRPLSSLIAKMLIFILAVACLTMSNLPWFMDVTFQVPMQYCSLQHPNLHSSPDTCTTECHSHFGPVASFFLELLVIVLCSSTGAYWIPFNLGGSSFGGGETTNLKFKCWHKSQLLFTYSTKDLLLHLNYAFHAHSDLKTFVGTMGNAYT